MDYQLYGTAGKRSISIIFADGEIANVNDTHPHFEDVVQAVTVSHDEVNEEAIRQFLKPALVAGNKLSRFSDRITFTENQIYFDGDSVDGSVANHIRRFIEEGRHINEYKYLVRFLEKAYTNPSVTSRDSLYDYLQRHNFAITKDGDIVAYKGVDRAGLSIHSGVAIVNDVVMNGKIPNAVGSVIEMSRSKVDDDTGVGCSHGLHAGTYEYARNFGQGRLLKVLINPRDVVSVPKDCNWQKIRTCRYTVLEESDFEWTEAVWGDEDYDEEEDNDFDDDTWDDDQDDWSENDEEEAPVATPVTVAPAATAPRTEFKLVPFADTAEVIQSAIDNKEKVAFLYVTVAGETRDVTGFEPEYVNLSTGTVVGGNINDEYRSYRLSGITDAVAYKSGETAVGGFGF